MIAIISLHDDVIKAPTPAEKEDTKCWVKKQVCPAWQNGYLSIDGTTFNLFQKPSHYGETFYDRKSNYSINAQVVTLPHNLKIVDYCVGHTGSTHNASAFLDTGLRTQPELFLGPGEWIWADSAYPLSATSLFKQPPGRSLTTRQSQFNYHLSCIRIRCEYAIGLLKIQFQSLKELCIQINTENKLEFAVAWIRCCIILHNLIIEGNQAENTITIPSDWQQGAQDNGGMDIDMDTDELESEIPENPNQDLRQSLFNSLFNSHLY
ncbi:hypothetical protein SERLADRAFT_349659 [Serpula lacrymans var. lacrymans S7.9]|uniref:DDE Tnp4 domain-containing protein n=1 Tax=Serpula lacrymans var. lacrymans (strain S7.9) TaxID=578457 RepID=F8P066_SERL9|nr:uncharacterized protein SERLADRAFT_349659 [Serpula lacrymans var. lacrymans S7.9]EGO24133.1 hypothetical protein SERLADRAFT_349659 [Serpula lacrymans var. lacrymans S7.9]